MYCDKCHSNPASVHVESVINGQHSVMNLCFECAASIAAVNTEMNFESIIKEFLGSVIGFGEGHSEDGEKPEKLACPRCGLSYEEFRKEGRIGCAECYQAFRSRLDGILKSIHGSSEHMGKIPKKAPREISLKRELGDLRRQLKDAIESEEFETAARLRDKIKLTESGDE